MRIVFNFLIIFSRRINETCPNSLDSESIRNSQFRNTRKIYPNIEEFTESKELNIAAPIRIQLVLAFSAYNLSIYVFSCTRVYYDVLACINTWNKYEYMNSRILGFSGVYMVSRGSSELHRRALLVIVNVYQKA